MRMDFRTTCEISIFIISYIPYLTNLVEVLKFKNIAKKFCFLYSSVFIMNIRIFHITKSIHPSSVPIKHETESQSKTPCIEEFNAIIIPDNVPDNVMYLTQ